MSTLSEVGHQVLHEAHLTPALDMACMSALAQPGHLFSASPLWARLFLSWIDALVLDAGETFLPAAVACECLAVGFDLIDDVIDDVYDQARGSSIQERLTGALTGGVILLLLAQEVMARLDLPAERRRRACMALSRASHRVLGGQVQDTALRGLPTATQDAVLAVLRCRSGTLVAAPCQCAALLTGAPWRIVALAGRFGYALGCAAQLEDDLTDRVEDERSGRTTIPTLLAQLSPASSELIEATTWVLIQRFLQDAARVLQRLPPYVRTDPLWTLLPPTMRAISHS